MVQISLWSIYHIATIEYIDTVNTIIVWTEEYSISTFNKRRPFIILLSNDRKFTVRGEHESSLILIDRVIGSICLLCVYHLKCYFHSHIDRTKFV